jgi:hypothetical protein
MHSIYRGSTVLPYHVLGRRPAQETLIDCAGLHKVKNSKTLNVLSLCIYVCEYMVIGPSDAGGKIFLIRDYVGIKRGLRRSAQSN